MAKDKVLDQAEVDAYLKKHYGDEGDPNGNIKRPKIFYGTGVAPIDWAFGGAKFMGGFPAGHMTEVYGREAVGKTSLVYRAIATAQKNHPDKFHVILDYECATDPSYIQACGVEYDKSKLRIHRPKTMEEGIEILLLYLKTGKLGIVCVDSLAAMNPGKELEKMGEDVSHMTVGGKAKLLTNVCRLLVPELAQTETSLIWINHELDNIVANPYASGHQPATTTPGGRGPKFYSSLRVQLNFKGMLVEESKTLDGKEIKVGVGKKIEAYVEKFKLGNPGQRVQYLIRAGEGIDTITPLIATAIMRKVVEKRGGTHTVKIEGVDATARSADAFRTLVRDDASLQAALTAAVGGEVDPSATTEEEADDFVEV